MSNDPSSEEQRCPHGDYRSCVVDGCRPLQRVFVPPVIIPPRIVPCMWCEGESAPDRGWCDPCGALLDAIQAAPKAGVKAIFAAHMEAETRGDIK